METAISASPIESSSTVASKRLFLIEDHPLFRAGLMAYLETEPDLIVAGQAATADEALTGLRQTECDCIVLDVSLPGSNGLELLKRIRAAHPEVRILVISMHDESQYALKALQAGAQGYVTKRETPGTLLEAVRTVLEGETYVSDAFASELIYQVVRAPQSGRNPLDVLTGREQEILRLVGEGCSSQKIAGALGLSVKTVESHRLHIKEKLRLPSAAELVRFATEWRDYERSQAAQSAS
jgi:DNA-binding NarL/FixJ family response regulator